MIGHFPPLHFLFLFQVRYFRVRSLLTIFVFVFDSVSRIGFVGRDEDSFQSPRLFLLVCFSMIDSCKLQSLQTNLGIIS